MLYVAIVQGSDGRYASEIVGQKKAERLMRSAEFKAQVQILYPLPMAIEAIKDHGEKFKARSPQSAQPPDWRDVPGAELGKQILAIAEAQASHARQAAKMNLPPKKLASLANLAACNYQAAASCQMDLDSGLLLRIKAADLWEYLGFPVPAVQILRAVLDFPMAASTKREVEKRIRRFDGAGSCGFMGH